MVEDLKVRGEVFDIGTISCAVALGYLEFRLPDIDWRIERRELDAWYTVQTARESFIKTDYI